MQVPTENKTQFQSSRAPRIKLDTRTPISCGSSLADPWEFWDRESRKEKVDASSLSSDTLQTASFSSCSGVRRDRSGDAFVTENKGALWPNP